MISRREAADQLGITTRTLDTYIRSGLIESHKYSARCVRLDQAEVDSFQDRTRKRPA